MNLDNHDCKENTCPFYAEHQNERARQHAAIGKDPLRGFKAIVHILKTFALSRAARRKQFGDDYAVRYASSWVANAEKGDPKLAELMRKSMAADNELDEYVLSRTDKN